MLTTYLLFIFVILMSLSSFNLLSENVNLYLTIFITYITCIPIFTNDFSLGTFKVDCFLIGSRQFQLFHR